MNDRLKSAFCNPAALSEADLADMAGAMKKDASTAAKRRNRLQNAGGSDDRGKARNDAEKQRRADLRKLKLAWG
ncbi:MAG: hypothetical protein WEB56_00420 [Roseovarius sp.]